MKTEQIQNWLQIAGLGGVILSLVFVGFEIQQSREIAIADVYQQRTALVMQAQTAFFTPDQWQAAYKKQQAGEEIGLNERVVLNTAMNLWFSYHENSHFQNELGLLSDEHWETGRAHIRYLMNFPTSREWWDQWHDQYRTTFATEVDQIIEGVLAEP